MAFKIKVIFSFNYKNIRSTNPTKLKAYKKEGSLVTKSEEIEFLIDKEKVNTSFKKYRISN